MWTIVWLILKPDLYSYPRFGKTSHLKMISDTGEMIFHTGEMIFHATEIIFVVSDSQKEPSEFV